MQTTVNGLPLYYEEHGAGEPILLLHGWGGKCDSFLPVTRDFSAKRRVIVLDFPGHGNTPEPPEAWSVTEYMELIKGFLDALKISGIDIIAHSFGGRVALLLGATYPEKVGKLLLTGGAGLPPKADAKKSRKSRVYKTLKKFADNGVTKKLLGEKAVDALKEKLIQKFGSADYKVLTPSMRATFNRVITQDLTWTLKKIQSPTLLIWGRNDTATPLWMGQTMEKEIPDAALIVLENTGHFAYLEKYADFYAIAANFFGIA